MRGFVYRDAKGILTLATIDARADMPLQISEREIGDDDRIYETMPVTKAEIVDVDDNEATGMCGLLSLCGQTFFKGETECPAYEAIEYGLRHDPSALKKILDEVEQA